MNITVNYALRALCLLAYTMAIGKWAGLIAPGSFDHSPLLATVLLGVHAAELVFMFKHVRLYKGPLAVSVLLTLLFGLLHWKPLADAQARAARQD